MFIKQSEIDGINRPSPTPPSRSQAEANKGSQDSAGAKSYAISQMKGSGEVLTFDYWGWDSQVESHVFGGTIIPNTGSRTVTFDIRIAPNASGGWKVASKKIKY